MKYAPYCVVVSVVWVVLMSKHKIIVLHGLQYSIFCTSKLPFILLSQILIFSFSDLNLSLPCGSFPPSLTSSTLLGVCMLDDGMQLTLNRHLAFLILCLLSIVDLEIIWPFFMVYVVMMYWLVWKSRQQVGGYFFLQFC